MSEKIPHIDADQFESQVLQGGKVALDFYSDECAPCAALAPKFEAMEALYGGEVKFFKIFRQKNRELATSLGVRSSPTVLFYENGAKVGDMLTGAIKRSDLVRNLDALAGAEAVASIHAQDKPFRTECDVLIIGGGPAGLTAAIYAAQAKKKTIVVDLNAMHGGQVTTTHLVSNFPGFPKPLSGMELGDFMGAQARVAGADFRAAVDVTGLDLQAKTVVVDGLETIHAKKVILAMGSSPRPLGIAGEKEYKGQGVSYCATCDAKYFEGKDVVVVGGGNSAIEESLFITQFARRVRIVHQFDKLQANKLAQEHARANPKIEFLLSHEPRAFRKTDTGMQVEVEDLKSKEHKTLETDGVFVFVGMKPNLDPVPAGLELDNWGYVKTDALMHTSIPDVFAAGDLAAKPIRQITVAVADGTIAAVQASRELG
ncbi:MAG TPA: FAD-dependent oxidoreductase [Fibrobacteraceae bacterium]|nr:FAD-dependent oxidoreductase [Fibrobacteraceae bacterium]